MKKFLEFLFAWLFLVVVVSVILLWIFGMYQLAFVHTGQVIFEIFGVPIVGITLSFILLVAGVTFAAAFDIAVKGS